MSAIDGTTGANRTFASISCAGCHTDGSIYIDIDVVPWVVDLVEDPHLDGYVTFFAADVSATI